MTFFVKETGIFVTALAIAIGVSIGVKSVSYNQGDPVKEKSSAEPIQLTHQEKFLQNVMNISKFDVEGIANFKTEGFQNSYDLNIDASGDLSDIDHVKVNGNLSANIDGIRLAGAFGYYDDAVFLDVDDNTKFKLDIESVTDFFTKLPTTYGIKFELPEELTSLDLDAITEQIRDMEEIITPSGEYFFIFELVEGLDLYLKTNSNYEFTGIRTDTIFFKGMYIKLDFNIAYVENTKYQLVDPREGPDAQKYQDLRPAFTLFDSLYKVFSDGSKSTFGLSLDVDKAGEDFLNSEIDLSLDFEKMAFSIVGDLNQYFKSADRFMNFSFDYLDAGIYAEIGNLKVSVQNETISDLINFFIQKTGTDVMGSLMDMVTNMLNDPSMGEMFTKAMDVVGEFTIEDGKMSLGLNLDVLSDQLTPVILNLTFAKEGEPDSFIALSIDGLAFQNYTFGFTLRSKSYVERNIVKESYVAVDPAIRLVDAVSTLIEQKKFRIEFDAKVVDSLGVKKDVNVDGGLQFDLEKNFGFGDVTIVDRDEYQHKIVADMKNADQILLSYNDTMDIKFNSQTMKEMLDLLLSIVKEPDDHFKELLADIFESFDTGILSKILNEQDYGALLSLRFISNLVIDNSKIKMDIDLSDLGFESSLTFELDYQETKDNEGLYAGSNIKGIKVYNLVAGDSVIEFNANLVDFNENLTAPLDPTIEYMDFSNIKVLLELGINTSRFNYYHFKITAALNTTLIGIKLGNFSFNFDIDVKIRNNHGKVQFAFEIDNMPVIKLLFGVIKINTNDAYDDTYDGTRKASFYFNDKMMYVFRTEKVMKKEGGFLGIGAKKVNYQYTMVRRFNGEYFADHILDIILGDVMGVSSTFMDLFSELNLSSDEQIRYEKILTAFVYNKVDHFFYFEINMPEIAHTNSIEPLYLTVNTNEDDTELNGITATMNISLSAIKLSINLNVELLDAEEELTEANRLSKLESFLTLYTDDKLPLNQKVENAARL